VLNVRKIVAYCVRKKRVKDRTCCAHNKAKPESQNDTMPYIEQMSWAIQQQKHGIMIPKVLANA
jgi:hypothetical protein